MYFEAGRGRLHFRCVAFPRRCPVPLRTASLSNRRLLRDLRCTTVTWCNPSYSLSLIRGAGRIYRCSSDMMRVDIAQTEVPHIVPLHETSAPYQCELLKVSSSKKAQERKARTHLSILHSKYCLDSGRQTPLFAAFALRHLRYDIMNSLHSPVDSRQLPLLCCGIGCRQRSLEGKDQEA